jgi:ribosomal protein S17E
MPVPLSGEELKQRIQMEMEIARREVERSSHDLWQVYNPLDKPFRFMYNRYWHSVPAKSYKNFEKFLMRAYLRAISNEIINQQINKKGEELMELRKKQFGQQFMDHYEENVQIWDRVPKINDPELINQIANICIIGLVEPFGLEEPEPEQIQRDLPQDFAPVHDRVLAGFMDRVASEHQTAAPETPPVDASVIEKLAMGQQPEDKPTAPIKTEKAHISKVDLAKEASV